MMRSRFTRSVPVIASLALAACGLSIVGASLGDAIDGGQSGGADGSNLVGDANDANDGMLADAGVSPCPSGRGPKMVLVDVSPMVRFCIDSTEVSRGQYTEFLGASPSIANQPSFCSWNVDFVPDTTIAPLTLTTLPVTKIDWCDAYAFCAWAGKRLCGSIADGGPMRASDGPLHMLAQDASTSEWMTACSHNNTNNFPYGPTWLAGKCNCDGGTAPAAVGSFAECVGGYDGLVDMTGNVTEWENFCDPGAGMGAKCLDRGGSYQAGAENRCNYASLDDITGRSSDWGIRCCATPTR